jgi:Xaa-Pro aminopeptidase
MVIPISTKRISAVQDEMRSRNLDALLVYSQKRGHVAFLSGYRPNYHTNSAFLLMPKQDDPTLLIKFGFDMPRARNLSWVQDIRPGGSENAVCLLQEFAGIVEEKGLQSARLGWVASDDAVDEMSAALFGAMQEALPKASIEPASDLVNRLRLYKDSQEIDVLRRSAEVAEIASDALHRSIKPGVEDFEAAGEAVGAATAAGAERCDVLLSLDPANHSLPPSHQRFQPGKSISMELTVQHDGYWVQICRTYCLGRANSLQERVFNACRDAYNVSVDAARPGVRASDVARAAIDVVDKAGFQGCIKYGLGHGVGLDLPEPWSIDPKVDAELVDHMCLVLHVGVWVDGASAFTGGPIIVNGASPLVLDHPQQKQIEI